MNPAAPNLRPSPPSTAALDGEYELVAPADDGYAAMVAGWIRDDRELYVLAPNTRPPASAAGVLEWRKEGRRPLLMVQRATRRPVAYGELNLLDEKTAEYWLGHLLTDPAQRGRGMGVLLTRLMIRRAFEMHAARRVSLVVFPENATAIRCYKRAGMIEAGYETHVFEAYGRTERLLRFAVDRGAGY